RRREYPVVCRAGWTVDPSAAVSWFIRLQRAALLPRSRPLALSILPVACERLLKLHPLLTSVPQDSDGLLAQRLRLLATERSAHRENSCAHFGLEAPVTRTYASGNSAQRPSGRDNDNGNRAARYRQDLHARQAEHRGAARP